MDCTEVRRALSKRADGEAAEESALDAHVGACDECAHFARAVDAARDHFRALPRPTAPDGLTARVLARLRSPGSRLLALRPMLRTWVAAAAAVLLLASGAAVLLSSPRPEEPSPITTSADDALSLLMSQIAEENAPAVRPEDGR